MRQPDTYKEPITISQGNIVARVYRPILTPEEEARRMKEISKAAGQLILSRN